MSTLVVMIILTEELIDSLCKFGLTTKQARAYLSIAINVKLRVPEIAKLTRIHEQDVYKILPRLEQMGLISKTATKPIIVKALPLEIAFKGIIKKQQENLHDSKKNTREIIESIKSKKTAQNPKEPEESVVIFHTKSQSYKNDYRYLLSRVRKTFDIIGDRDSVNRFLRRTLPYFKEHECAAFEKYQVKIRLLCRYRNLEKDVFEDIDAKHYSTLNIEIKKVRTKYTSFPSLTYSIIDGKEIWAASSVDPTNPAKVVVTDCIPIVQIAQENFEKYWQDSNAELIFSTKPTNDLTRKVAPNSN